MLLYFFISYWLSITNNLFENWVLQKCTLCQRSLINFMVVSSVLKLWPFKERGSSDHHMVLMWSCDKEPGEKVKCMLLLNSEKKKTKQGESGSLKQNNEGGSLLNRRLVGRCSWFWAELELRPEGAGISSGLVGLSQDCDRTSSVQGWAASVRRNLQTKHTAISVVNNPNHNSRTQKQETETESEHK